MSERPLDPTLQGVGGWLLFFCIAFTVFWPLWVSAYYVMFPRAFYGFAVLGLARLGLGFIAGVFLWTKRPAAIILLRVYFALGAVLFAWALINWMAVIARVYPTPLVMMGFFMSLVAPAVFLIGGVLYFSQSERVRAIYGSKLF